MNILVMAGQMILALSILITLHELGHYLAARAFGIKVEKFFLFFDAGGFKLFSFKKGDTEYGIGWLPLGGYVKISGMIDESMDTKQLKSEPQEWEFRSKPAWQRLIVMLAGVTVNVILGVFVMSMSVFYYGEKYLPNDAAIHGISATGYAEELGFRDGDKIVSINDKSIENFEEIYNPDLFLDAPTTIVIQRDGQQKTIVLPEEVLREITDKGKKMNQFITYRTRFAIQKVAEGSIADKAGILAGDSIVSMNDTAVEFYHTFRNRLLAHSGKDIKLTIKREDSLFQVETKLEEDGILGFNMAPEQLNFGTEHYGLGQSFVRGTNKAFATLFINIKALGKVFSGDVDPRKSLMGPIQLATIFGSVWNWQNFWGLTALLSMVLAFMNVLPIPALDGGHALFLTIEMVTGRPLGDKFLQVAQVIGMVILLSLMIFVFGNDIWNLIS